MNTEHPISACMDTHDRKGSDMTSGPNNVRYSQVSSSPLSSSTVSSTEGAMQRTQTGKHSTFSLHNMADIPKRHIHSLVEISLSPAKYSIFQVLGFKFFERIERAGTPPLYLSLKSAAIVGALGGTLLSFLYLVLLFRRRHLASDELNITSCFSYIQVLCKEIAYSGLAGIIGASAIGRSSAHELGYFAISGILGPVLFLVLMFGVVGMVIGVVWVIERVKYRRCFI